MNTEPTLALQTAVRARLLASPELTSLVDADAILDRHRRPEGERQIIIGEGIALYPNDFDSFLHTVSLDLHIWTREPGFTVSKEIAFAAREALRNAPWEAGGYVVHGATVSARFIRDPGHEFAHAVLSLDVNMKEATCSPAA